MHVLVTGATGFIGGALLPHLARAGLRVRILLRPARTSPRLPRGLPVEVALAALTDARGLRAAMVGIDAVIHLASGERAGIHSNLTASDIIGTRNLAEAAADAGVRRFVFLSHLGADRLSAYPVLRAKAAAEDLLRQSPLPFTILRSAVVYGPNDRFTTSMAMTLSASPIVYWIPGEGTTLLQPLWIEDLVTAVAWTLEDDALIGQTYEIGGPEYLSYLDILHLVMQASGVRRIPISVGPPYVRLLLRIGEIVLPRPMMTTYWLDYLATHRTAELSTLPRAFGLQPSRMETRLKFLGSRRWGREMIAQQMAARAA
ncbi:MAG TPA: NAD(P)H-binding protein [Anaerolineales bacterium]|nr:NAD(P)H-binding protein [Anaerolineales bacterium]